MKHKGTMLVVACALTLAPVTTAAASRDSVTIRTTLTATQPRHAEGVARLTVDEGRSTFRVKVRGLDPGAYRLLVGGLLQGFVFVNASRTGELLFDSRAFDDEGESGLEESEAMGLSFDPRGRAIQVERDGDVVLEAVFPSRPLAGRR